MSTSERVVCASCSANNFATQAACWKCGKSLSATATAAPPIANNSPSPAFASSTPAFASPATVSAVSYERPVASEYVSPSTATAAAVVLGLLFPALAIPVGIIFLMLDNKRKTAIGWQNIIWGVVGSVLHLIVTAASFTPLMMYAMSKGIAAGQQNNSSVMEKIQNQQQNNLQQLGENN
jgi:hypothetical protein